jgi:hypothetical protein
MLNFDLIFKERSDYKNGNTLVVQKRTSYLKIKSLKIHCKLIPDH